MPYRGCLLTVFLDPRIRSVIRVPTGVFELKPVPGEQVPANFYGFNAIGWDSPGLKFRSCLVDRCLQLSGEPGGKAGKRVFPCWPGIAENNQNFLIPRLLSDTDSIVVSNSGSAAIEVVVESRPRYPKELGKLSLSFILSLLMQPLYISPFRVAS